MAFAYTRQLAWHDSTAAEDVALGTVPAGRIWVIRDVVIDNTNATTSTVAIYGRISGQPATWTLLREDLLAEKVFHWEGRLAVPAGQVIRWVTTQSSCRVVVTGYDLTAI